MYLFRKQKSATEEVRYGNIGHSWVPGKIHRLPWGGLCFVLGALCGLIAAILLLVLSHGDPITSWKYPPTVYLSVAYTITNTLLAAALAQGATIAWWRKASGTRTSLEDLHNWWAFSASIKEIVLAGRKTNLIAIAALLVAVAPVNGPLFQRATSIRLRNIALSGETVLMPAVKKITIGSGYLTGRNYEPGFLTPQFEPVARAFLDGDEIILTNTGCPTNGICTGWLEAAGFAIDCSDSTTAFNNTADKLSTGAIRGYPFNEVFSTSFNWAREKPLLLSFSMKVKETEDCKGVIVTKGCSLRVATLRYPVVIDGSRKTIALKRGTTIFDDELVANSTESGSEGSGQSILSGIFNTLNVQYSSKLTMGNTGTMGYSMDTSNNALLAQFADYHGMDRYGGLNSALMGPDACHLRFDDPFDYIMNKTRELLFRKALADGNSSTTQTITVDVQMSTNVYHTEYAFVAIATVLTLLAIVFVSATFHGYWELGRDVSLSPLEIAKAFNAPLLATEDSNSDAKGLVKSFGDKAVRYGVIAETTEETSVAGVKGNSTVKQSGVESARLGIAERNAVRAPRAGQHFRP